MLRYLSTGLRPFGDHPMPPHKRLNWEFYAVIGGQLAPWLAEQTPAPPVSDTLWLFAPGCEHGWQCEPNRDCEVVVFHYSTVPMELRKLTGDEGFAAVHLKAGDKRLLTRLASSLLPHVQQSSSVGDMLVERALLDLGLLMLQRAPLTTPVSPASVDASPQIAAATSGSAENRVLAAEKWFQSHLSQQPTADETARAVGLSPAHLRRLFWQVRHRSPREVFHRLRLQHAMVLLAQSDLKLASVAAESGFATPSHFCQAFKKDFGATPDAWRRFAYIQYRHPDARPMTPEEVQRNLRLLGPQDSEPDQAVVPIRMGAAERSLQEPLPSGQRRA